MQQQILNTPSVHAGYLYLARMFCRLVKEAVDLARKLKGEVSSRRNKLLYIQYSVFDIKYTTELNWERLHVFAKSTPTSGYFYSRWVVGGWGGEHPCTKNSYYLEIRLWFIKEDAAITFFYLGGRYWQQPILNRTDTIQHWGKGGSNGGSWSVVST